jgi:hypothetical protein
VEENTIRIGGESIEALDDGKIAINGKELTSVYEMEHALNILIKACIAIVRG